MSTKKNILVTGANGQLGMEFRALEKEFPYYNFIFTGREELSITDYSAVDKLFSINSFTNCINCAAYTAVDKAESEKESAFAINGFAIGNLGTVCKKYNCNLIHISTDYVFDGNNSSGYKETDPTNPINVYGASKLKGEQLLLETNPDAIIIRTSWVYSNFGKNFVKTMLRLMKEKESISVVNDQFGCPTYAADIAAAVTDIISLHQVPAAGIYHYCNSGITSWFEFALEIKKITGSTCQVHPITTAGYPTPARRPLYSVMNTDKIRHTFQLGIPAWKDSLQKCLSLPAN